MSPGYIWAVKGLQFAPLFSSVIVRAIAVTKRFILSLCLHPNPSTLITLLSLNRVSLGKVSLGKFQIYVYSPWGLPWLQGSEITVYTSVTVNPNHIEATHLSHRSPSGCINWFRISHRILVVSIGSLPHMCNSKWEFSPTAILQSFAQQHRTSMLKTIILQRRR